MAFKDLISSWTLSGWMLWGLAGLWTSVGNAQVVLFSEDFDSLEPGLSTGVGETQCTSVTGWTHQGPMEWSINSSSHTANSGITEWQGWCFTTLDFWTCADTQERGSFTRSSGVFAVADPDEWDDTTPAPTASGTFLSRLNSPPIGIPADTPVLIEFDSHYRQESPQRAEFLVSVEGEADQILLQYSSDPSDDNAGGDVLNVHLSLSLPASTKPTTMVLMWYLHEAGNNWYWAIDNVRLSDARTIPIPTPSPTVTVTPTPSPTPTFGPTPTLPNDAPRKLLLIGIDGCRADSLLAADTPHIDSVISNGTYSYEGMIRDGQATVSGPGWSSMLMGVWADKHTVYSNDFSTNHYAQYPMFFRRLREVWPDVYAASVVHWSPINSEIVAGADEELYGTDAQVGQLGAEALANPDLDVLFLAFDDVDGAGHTYGYGPGIEGYLTAIETTDDYIGLVLAGLYGRPTFYQENWLIILTADHGGIGTSHGGNTLEERTIFLIVSGPDSRKGMLTPAPDLVDTAATALTFLTGGLDCAWDMDGKAVGLDATLYPEPSPCPECPVNLSCTINQQTGEVILQWTPGERIEANGYEILRDGETIGTIALTEDTFTDHPSIGSSGVRQTLTYSLHVMGASPAGICEEISCTAEFFTGEVFYSEDFESLESSLGVAVGETGCVSVPGWTHVPPDGWSIDNSAMNMDTGILEWRGWSFATPSFWVCADDQYRSLFNRGRGIIAIADPDEWDDSSPAASASGPFNSTLISPPVQIQAGNETLIVFDSHYRQESPQQAQFRVSLNGGADEILLSYSSAVSDDNAGADVLNDQVRLVIPAQATDSVLEMKWALLDAGNNWYWAIDNLVLYRPSGIPGPTPTPESSNIPGWFDY